jgi:uncharacterized membrane-anchored protein
MAFVARAKKNHDEVETHYVPNMDFTAITARRQQILDRILELAAEVEAREAVSDND